MANGKVFLKSNNDSGMGDLFFKDGCCLSGLGIVRKNRRIPKYFNNKKMFVLSSLHFFILNSVLSLRSFNHEFSRFEKKYDPWSDLTNKIIQPI